MESHTIDRLRPVRDPGRLGEFQAPAEEGLGVLLAAIAAEAALTTGGYRRLAAMVSGAIDVRLRVAELRAKHPEVDAIRIDRPIFVTGLHRSGTTLLHRLLACHPGLRAPALWEQLSPADGCDIGMLRQRARRYVTSYNEAAPGFADLHWLDADEPDECHRLMTPSFRSPIFGLRYRVPSYERWLETQDPAIAYACHQTVLRCILWRRPASRVVLKCPFHLAYPLALRSLYPDALIVRLHRDPAQTIPSACLLTATIRAAHSAAVNPVEIGQEWLRRTTALTAPLTERGWSGDHDDDVIDIRYSDLIDDPLRVCERILCLAGLSTSPVAMAGFSEYLERAGRQASSSHQRTLSAFGLDLGDLRNRFCGYRAAFGIT